MFERGVDLLSATRLIRAVAKPLFDAAVTYATKQGMPVVTGRFGEHMKVSLVNNGPMTLLIDTERRF